MCVAADPPGMLLQIPRIAMERKFLRRLHACQSGSKKAEKAKFGGAIVKTWKIMPILKLHVLRIF